MSALIILAPRWLPLRRILPPLAILVTALALQGSGRAQSNAASRTARRCGVMTPVPSELSAADAVWRRATSRLAHSDPDASVDDLPTRKTGVQKLLFLRVRYRDDHSDPVSEAEAAETLAWTHDAFQRISHGRYGIAGTVTPVLALASSRSDYDVPGGFDRLITDAREAALTAGFDYREFDLEVVRHSGVPSFAGGNARLGVRGAQVQVGGVGILVHEIGHNLGLSHANFWETAGPGIAADSPPLPTNYQTLPEPRSIPLHPDSVIGHETVTGPGQSLEYGDPWDIMGVGDVEFGGASKTFLGWLSPDSVTNAPPGRSEFRLFEPAATNETSGPLRWIRIPIPHETPVGTRAYCLELAPPRPGATPEEGILIRWIDPTTTPRGSLLLDTTPGTAGVNSDAILAPGRTFSDPQVPLHVTVTNTGTNAAGLRWADVVVVRDRATGNRPPEITLAANATSADPDQPLTLTATVSDADGDDLALRLDFGDGTSTHAMGSGPHSFVHAWKQKGDVNVRVVATDLRGGLGMAYRSVRIGNPGTRRVQGTVRDNTGAPIAGARVHNGIESRGRPSENLVETRTDSQGRYTLVGLQPGHYSIAAFHPQFVIHRLPPIDLTDADRDEVELTGHALPRVTVAAPELVVEGAGHTNLFTFRRTGPVDDPLTVYYRLSGTANGGTDYARPLLDRLVLPAGSATATLGLSLIDDSVGEAPETIAITVTHPSRFTSTDASGNLVVTYYPGWEAALHEGQIHWTRTRPDYLPGDELLAAVQIADDDDAKAHTVSISSPGLIAFESPLVESEFHLTRSGATEAPLVVALEAAGTATPGVDYEAIPFSVTFPRGHTLLVLPVRPIADDLQEPGESLEIRIAPSPNYGVENGNATVLIQDHPEFPQTLGLALRPDGQFLLTMKGPPGALLVLESSSDLVGWVPVRTNRLFNSDSATVLLPSAGGSRFFRTVRP